MSRRKSVKLKGPRQKEEVKSPRVTFTASNEVKASGKDFMANPSFDYGDLTEVTDKFKPILDSKYVKGVLDELEGVKVNGKDIESKLAVIAGEDFNTNLTDKFISILDAQYVKTVLAQLETIKVNGKDIEAKLVNEVGEKFNEKTIRMTKAHAQIKGIRAEIKQTTSISGLLRLFKDYNINRVYRNKETGYKQPLDESLGFLMGKLADEIIVLL